MCSIFTDEIESTVKAEDYKIVEQKDTCKCGCEDIVLRLNLYGSFCRECFLQRVAHKFRSEFGKSRLVRDNENVAVAFSGGKKSTVMVNLITEGLSKRAQKKLRFNPTLIHVIEPKQWELAYTFDCEIVKTLFSLEIPFYIFSLSQVFDEDVCPLLSDKDDVKNYTHEEFLKKIDFTKFYDMRKSLKQPTSMESMHVLLKRQLLRRICSRMNLSKILIGETAYQLAVRLISFVSQGRGGQLSYEMEFADERNNDVTFIKPMRAFLDEEVDKLLELKSLNFFQNASKWNVQTIESLTEDFIKKLQSENDKTLSIICRTGEKLTVTKEKTKSTMDKENVCSMCQAPIEYSASKLTADLAVSISSNIAEELKKKTTNGDRLDVFSNGDADVASRVSDLCLGGTGGCRSGSRGADRSGADDCCGESTGCCSKNEWSSFQVTKSDVLGCLCHGCRVVVKNMDDVSKLPLHLLAKVNSKIRRRKMKECINDYILDEDADFIS